MIEQETTLDIGWAATAAAADRETVQPIAPLAALAATAAARAVSNRSSPRSWPWGINVQRFLGPDAVRRRRGRSSRATFVPADRRAVGRVLDELGRSPGRFARRAVVRDAGNGGPGVDASGPHVVFTGDFLLRQGYSESALVHGELPAEVAAAPSSCFSTARCLTGSPR